MTNQAQDDINALRATLAECLRALNQARGFGFQPTSGNPLGFDLVRGQAKSYDLAARVSYVLTATKN